MAHGRRALSEEEAEQLIWAGGDKMMGWAFERAGGPLPDHEADAALTVFLDDYGNNCTVETRFFPGALEAIDTLLSQECRVALCTNKRTSLTRRVLDGLNAGHLFEPVVCGDTVATRKPEPEMIHHILDHHGIDRSESVMVGDSFADVDAAKAAGVTSIAVSHGYSVKPVHELGADAVIDHFDALVPALSKIAG